METGGHSSVEVENLAPLIIMICRHSVQKIKQPVWDPRMCFSRIGVKPLPRIAFVSHSNVPFIKCIIISTIHLQHVRRDMRPKKSQAKSDSSF